MSFTALSVIQPWPWAILRPDVTDAAARAKLRERRQIKDVENREWETPFRGWALLHASSTRLAKWDYTAAALFCARQGVEVPMREGLPYGAVVGAIRVDECRGWYGSPWFVGPKGFVIGAAVPFAEPVACSGAPRFFQIPLPGDGSSQLQKQLEAAIRAAGMAAAFKLEAKL